MILWLFVGAYLASVLFALARNWNTGAHGLRRCSARDTARVVLEATAWPVEALCWSLAQYFAEQWHKAQPRYQGVG